MRLRLDRRAALGLATVLVTFGGFLFVGSGQFARLFDSSDRTVKITFANAQQLRDFAFMRTGSNVRINGVDVGVVKRISQNPGSRSATATVGLEDDAGPLYADARAALRWQTLLGANFYISLDRGHARSGPLGADGIPARNTSNQVELEDVISMLKGDARTGLRVLPKQLAAAVDDPSELRRILTTVNRIAPDGAVGLRALRGEDPDRDLRAVLASTRTVLRALAAPDDRLRDLVAGASATVSTTAGRQAELRRLIARSPAALRITQATLGRLEHTLDLLDPVVDDLQAPAPQVGPTLAALRPTVVRAERLLRSARPLLRSLRPTMSSLADTSRQGLPLLQRLTPALENLNARVLPYLDEKDHISQRTTAEMIGPAISVYASSGGLVDDIGRAIRFPLSVGNSTIYGPCQTYPANPDHVGSEVQCQTLQDAMSAVLSYNPLDPAPGTGSRSRSQKKGGHR
jgi:virulence factor Mce-like protein